MKSFHFLVFPLIYIAYLKIYFCFLFIVYTDPWIACPIDRVEELEADKSTVVLGYKWQLPRTNMKNVTVSPSNYDENYAFPVGRHRVTWIGTSDSGTQKSCSFHITVNGEMIFQKLRETSNPFYGYNSALDAG